MGNTSTNVGHSSQKEDPGEAGAVELSDLREPEQTPEEYDKWLKGAVLIDEDDHPLVSAAEFLNSDLIISICTEYLEEVADVVHFLTCSSSLVQLSATGDKLLWAKLVNRDFPTLFLAEASRERQIVFTEEKYPHIKLDIRRQSIAESIRSFAALYIEAYEYFYSPSRVPATRHIIPYQLVVLNHTTKFKQVFCTLDCIRGVPPGSVVARLGDSIQVEMYFREEKGLNQRVHFHNQIVRWNYGPNGLYKDMGFGGIAVADRQELKFSYWQTFHPRDTPCIYQTKLNCSNNALKWPNVSWVDQWSKYRYFASIGDTPFKNPGPYPSVQLQGQDKDEKPLFELSVLLRTVW